MTSAPQPLAQTVQQYIESKQKYNGTQELRA